MSGVRAVVSSILRHTGSEASSGYVRIIDLADQRILAKWRMRETSYRANDPNPRGGLRGARGISVYGDRLLIANTEQVLIFDSSWRLVGKISHPLMGGVHDILAEEGGIWVTCASADLLLKFAWNGELSTVWEWRSDESLRASFGFGDLPPVNLTADYRNPETSRNIVSNIVHLNGISRGSEGLLISFGRVLSAGALRKLKLARFMGGIARSVGVERRKKGCTGELPVATVENTSSALILLRKDGRTKILRKESGNRVPNHNIIETAGVLVHNDSNGDRVVRTPMDGNGGETSVTIPGAPAFARGLVQLDEHRFLVGSQKPAAIYRVNFQSGCVEEGYLLHGEPNETVYGICILPPRFDDPPAEMEL